MSYVSLRELLRDAEKESYAVGAFNIFNYQTARAVVDASEEVSSPLIIQTSVKTVQQLGIEAMIDFLRPMAEKAKMPVAIHLDHCTKVELAKQCIDAGWSSIMFDGSALPFSENIRATHEIAAYIREKGGNISLEGEIGAIVGVEDDIFVKEDEECLADAAHCAEYIEKTGVDALAPAIGTAHGIYKGEPKIAFDLFSEIHSSVSTPLVVHGGTGLAEDVFRRLIMAGASKINVSTAIKIAYLDAAKEAVTQTDPLKFDAYVQGKVKDVVLDFLRIFGSGGRPDSAVAYLQQ